MSTKWVVYATYDPEGAAAPFVSDQLTAYRELGFNIVIVDTSPRLSVEREACWRKWGTRWLQRPNVGYDFGSYRAGLHLIENDFGFPDSELSVVFANDSCYGPFTPLRDVFAFFDKQPLDAFQVFGITDSRERGRHLQSYFLYFRPDVAHLAVAFFAAMPIAADRATAVEMGELALSRHLLAKGCQLTALCPVEKVVEHFAGPRWRLDTVVGFGVRWLLKRPRYTRNGDRACLQRFLRRPYACNVTIAFGPHMHLAGLTPFVKRELIRANPNHDPLVPAKQLVQPLDNESVWRSLRSRALEKQR